MRILFTLSITSLSVTWLFMLFSAFLPLVYNKATAFALLIAEFTAIGHTMTLSSSTRQRPLHLRDPPRPSQ